MENTMKMPVCYNVLSCEEMTYTEGGASMVEAIFSWFVPYGWYKGVSAVRDYRSKHPNTWTDTGLDALTNYMEKSAENAIYTIGCTASVISVCATGFGLIPTALIVFGK